MPPVRRISHNDHGYQKRNIVLQNLSAALGTDSFMVWLLEQHYSLSIAGSVGQM